MADLALLALIVACIVVALHRDRHRTAPTRPGFRIDSIVIDETHEWATLDELDAMRAAWSAHWNDLMPDRIEWETVPLAADDLGRGFEALNYVFSGHLVGEADIETMPEGCWRTVNHPDGAYAPCNQPPVSDLGLCATHLDELASQGASR